MRMLVPMIFVLGCHGGSSTPPDTAPPAAKATGHSSSIAVSADGTRVYVVNADADSVSVIDTAASALVTEIALGPTPVADGTGAYTPAIMPRALALSPDGATLYVTGERAGMLFMIDLASNQINSVAVGSEPIGVVVSADGESVYVACSQDQTVVQVSVANRQRGASVMVPGEPWALGWSPTDGSLIATNFMGPGITAIDPVAMTAIATYTIPDTAPRSDPRLAHGAVRGLYDVVARPGTDELWVAHAMLGIDTAQPDLDFEETVFPSLSIVHASGAYEVTLSTDAQDVPGIDGSFVDVVSGPHSVAFTSDGALALVADTNSEDVLAVDAAGHVQAKLLRPLPGHMPEGIAISPDDSTAYVDERNTGDVAVIHIDRSTGVALSVDATPISRFASDPMPATVRFGQHLFYSANSDEYPITKNHWVACASCHMEGRSDAVTWKFAQGPRDTPTNAGGMLGTGFLFRTADRNQVSDYWHTVNIEQGGNFDPVAQATLLAAITTYVNYGIPAPIPPTTDPAMVARGAQIFASDTVGCSGCHSGPRLTDSGANNPTLVLSGAICDDSLTACAAGTVNLHDVGTCNTGAYPDVAHLDVGSDARPACMFDTPSLTGIASSPPYLHDGSAATLHDVLELTRGKMGDISSLSAADESALVEYLRSL